MMWGTSGWGMGLGSLLFLALVVIGIVLLVRGSSEDASLRTEDGARRLLDERFARGEIDEDDYRQRRLVLEGSKR